MKFTIEDMPNGTYRLAAERHQPPFEGEHGLTPYKVFEEEIGGGALESLYITAVTAYNVLLERANVAKGPASDE